MAGNSRLWEGNIPREGRRVPEQIDMMPDLCELGQISDKVRMSENLLSPCNPGEVLCLGLTKCKCQFHRIEIFPECLVKFFCGDLDHLFGLVGQHDQGNLAKLCLDLSKNVVKLILPDLGEQQRDRVSPLDTALSC